MDEQQLKKIINDIAVLDFVHAKIKLDDFELELDRPDTAHQFTSSQQSIGELITIKSPMIGIFHENEQPVVSGQTVTAGAVVGQIESMKLFNELTSTVTGTVVNVLCQDGQAVEYDQPLFEIREGVR